MTKQFKNVAEWMQYCKSLETTILKLTQDINILKEKNENLEEVIKKTTPIIQTEEQKQLQTSLQNVEDEEAIAIMELAKLKDICLQRDLNMDECRRYDVYTKSLLTIREKRNSKPSIAENLNDNELLSILDATNK